MMIAGQESDAEALLICLILGDDTRAPEVNVCVCVCVIKGMWVCVFSLFHAVSLSNQMLRGSLPASNLNDSSCPSDPTYPRVTSPLMEIRLHGILQKFPPSQASLLIHRGIPGRRHVNVVRRADAPFVNHVWHGRGKLEGQTFSALANYFNPQRRVFITAASSSE